MPEPLPTGDPDRISKEEIVALTDKILQSKAFANSAALRRILEYIVRKGLVSPAEPIKEYSIATEVLGRSEDFDPKTDNIVRVQMHRLREKLEEYYQNEGNEERVRISVPRGHYTPEYARNSEPRTDLTDSETRPAPRARGSRLDLRWIAILALVFSNVVVVFSFIRHDTLRRQAILALSLRSLWQPFFSHVDPPLVVFANPAFLVGKHGNLYRYSSPDVISMAMGTRVSTLDDQYGLPAVSREAGPLYYFDSYTGTGELVAAADVARFLTAQRERFVIERSRLVSDAQIARNNVIFLGGNKEDRLLRRFPVEEELVFEPPPPGEYAVGSYIKDLNPPNGSPPTYHLQLAPRTGAIQRDYALISLVPNVSPGRFVLDLAGLTTLGTQAAAEFVTSEPDMAEFAHMLGSSGNLKLSSPFFQALLVVTVRDGVPLDAHCVLVRELKESIGNPTN
jgi:hypothetical protein